MVGSGTDDRKHRPPRSAPSRAYWTLLSDAWLGHERRGRGPGGGRHGPFGRRRARLASTHTLARADSGQSRRAGRRRSFPARSTPREHSPGVRGCASTYSAYAARLVGGGGGLRPGYIGVRRKQRDATTACDASELQPRVSRGDVRVAGATAQSIFDAFERYDVDELTSLLCQVLELSEDRIAG